MKARSIQVWLLSGARLVCQANRLNLGGVMPLVSVELGLSTMQKGSLLSAFPLGYLLTQVLGGMASDRFGGKPVMGMAVLSTAVGVIVYSSLSTFSSMWWTMIIMGALQGPSFPTNGVILAKWVPKCERASATAISDAGGPAGALVALFITPVLADYGGWRLAMLCTGIGTFGFTALWFLLAVNEPTQCKYISIDELDELRTLGVIASSPEGPAKAGSHHVGFPWRILSFPESWSVLSAHTCFNYIRYLMYNWIVTYYTDVLNLSVAEAGRCMLWPNLVDAVASVCVGKFADGLANSGRMSTLWIRRLFTTLGFCCTGMGALLIAFCKNPFTVTVLVTFASGMQAFHNAGFKSSYSDLSKKYNGVLGGLGNMLATGSSFVVPLLAASILQNFGGSKSTAAWQAVFFSVFLVSIGGSTLYMSLVSTEPFDPKLESGKSKKED